MTTPLQQGDLRLLETDAARRLFASTTPHARIAVRPTWVGLVDFEAQRPRPRRVQP